VLTRKQFLRSSLELFAATLGLVVLNGCSGSPTPPRTDGGVSPHGDGGLGTGAGADGSGSGSNTGACVTDGTQVTIGSNHGHVLVVTKDEVAAGAAKTYHIQGTSDHDHTVTVRADDFAQLQQDQAIMTVSSFDADHSHPIMIACA
jgi:hypothetical protein